MPLFIGTTLICLTALWFVVLLVLGRNPNPPGWVDNSVLGDLQLPMAMGLAVVGFWFLTRFPGGLSPTGPRAMIDIAAAVGTVAATALIIRQMKVKRRLRQFEEMAADDPQEEQSLAKPAVALHPYRKLPWQVRLHLADTLGYDLAWIRTLRCVVREVKGQPGAVRFFAFHPDQARERGLAVDDFDAVAAQPELAVVSGTFETHGQRVSIDAGAHPRAAA